MPVNMIAENGWQQSNNLVLGDNKYYAISNNTDATKLISPLLEVAEGRLLVLMPLASLAPSLLWKYTILPTVRTGLNSVPFPSALPKAIGTNLTTSTTVSAVSMSILVLAVVATIHHSTSPQATIVTTGHHPSRATNRPMPCTSTKTR